MPPAISAVARALPPHYADQEALITAFRSLWAAEHYNVDRLEDLHRAVQVGGRHLARPIEDYAKLVSFADRNNAWTDAATEIGARVVKDALARAGLAPKDVDHIFFVTVTGIATPSIDARLVDLLAFRSDIKRTPIFGLGCVAGAAGIARASDYLRAFPDQVAVLLSVELCSLTLQRSDLSVANIIASGLFGDGAAAVVLTGAMKEANRARGPRVVASRSIFYSDTHRMMGWDVVDGGFKVVLSSKVPKLVVENVGGDVDRFLGSQGLARKDIRHFVAHTGGPKVLSAFEEALGLDPNALARSRKSLRETGNLSSASVLFVLEDLLASGEAKPGDRGIVMAMGPGFCAELVLLEW